MFIVFTCRYYEGSDPPVNPPPSYSYPTMCCSVALNTSRMCGIVGGTTFSPCITNPSDIACCNTPASDCVYNGFCYTDDNDPNSAELWTNMTCSIKHWCPLGFEWNPIFSHCEPGTTPCYAGTNPQIDLIPPSCVNPFNNPTAYCLDPYPLILPNTYYTDSCCYWTSIGILYFYEWKDIIIYSGSSGNWVNLQELEHEFEG